MNSPAEFRYSGRDAFPQFALSMFVVGLGVLLIPVILRGWWVLSSVVMIVVYLAVSLLVAVGLRFSIEVSAEEVVIKRWWFGIPYRSHRGRTIEDVFFGGDWGEEDRAIGVVVQLDGREYHIGSHRSMRDLHAALLQFVSRS